ncbi:hypothetical protein GTP45_11735 [Pseudoduganella sp. FT55W]|uniref:Uncharacterized protein n=1 Tax=Duganella rivi TaxID=2666083 RepID=A0A7X4GPZ8_9BURK|nr:hypothetical protein [Duganella rivi]MYM67498.1 hypothetical protein [Duganella rivi]
MKTLIKFFDSPIVRLCGMISAGAIFLAAYNLISWSTLTAADWGTWFGAVGTIGAIIGAIYIAGAQERWRHRDAMIAAKICASSNLLQLAGTRADVKEAAAWFERCSKEDLEIRIFLAFGDVLAESIPLNQEELIRLAPLPKNCAFKIAAAQDRVRIAIRLIRSVGERNPDFTSNRDVRMQEASHISLALTEAARQYDMAVNEMQIQTSAVTSPFRY